MPYYFFIWNPAREEKFEQIVENPHRVESSRSSDRQIAFGYLPDGRWVACVYEMLDEDLVLPITAFCPEDLWCLRLH
jgi:uncharacterized DUF497 family protein